MELKVLFPQWRAASTNPDINWDREIDLSEDATFFTLLAAIVEDQAASSQKRPREFTPICNAIMVDILALQGSPPDNCKATNLQYLQFEATLAPLRMALIVGDFGLTHDWIIDGCCENLAHAIERPFQQGRIAEFMASDMIGYRVSLYDNAMGAVAEGVTDSGPVRVPSVRTDFRRAEHPPAKVLHKVIGIGTVALANAIGDDRLLCAGQSGENVLVARIPAYMEHQRLPIPQRCNRVTVVTPTDGVFASDSLESRKRIDARDRSRASH